MRELTESDQLSVMETAQILNTCLYLDCFPQTLSFLSVSWHRSAVPNSLQTHVGAGLEGKTAGQGRGGDRRWGKGREMETIFYEPLNPRLSAFTDHQHHVEASCHRDTRPARQFLIQV